MGSSSFSLGSEDPEVQPSGGGGAMPRYRSYLRKLVGRESRPVGSAWLCQSTLLSELTDANNLAACIPPGKKFQ